MDKKPKLLMVLTHADEISRMLEEGSSSVDVQAFLKKKGCEVSNKHLRANLKRIFPQYLVNGRWAPMKKRCDKELEAFRKIQAEAAGTGDCEPSEHITHSSNPILKSTDGKLQVPSPAVDSGEDCQITQVIDTSPGDQKSEGVDNNSLDSSLGNNAIQHAFKQEDSTSHNPTEVLATLASGVTIDADIKGKISEEHYRLISKVYPNVANSDNAIRGLLSQSVFGREYLRMKHEVLEKTKDMEK